MCAIAYNGTLLNLSTHVGNLHLNYGQYHYYEQTASYVFQWWLMTPCGYDALLKVPSKSTEHCKQHQGSLMKGAGPKRNESQVTWTLKPHAPQQTAQSTLILQTKVGNQWGYPTSPEKAAKIGKCMVVPINPHYAKNLEWSLKEAVPNSQRLKF